MLKDYTVSVENTFQAENPADAVIQMAEWLAQYSRQAGYRVEWDIPHLSIFLDAEEVYDEADGLD